MKTILPIKFNVQKYRFKYLALYHGLREAILSGKLAPGYKLPSTRELATIYEVNRNTVRQVYEMLMADGYIRTEMGSGTFVSTIPVKETAKVTLKKEIRLSDWGSRLPIEEPPSERTSSAINFGIGFTPELAHFPELEWRKAVNQAARELNYLILSKDPEQQGLFELREAIATYLRKTRGIICESEDIYITNGTMHAFSILAQLLIRSGDHVVIEDPTFGSMKDTILALGGKLLPVPVHSSDFLVKDWDSNLVYVTPSHQYPTGKVMPLEQRLALLEWAKQKNALIIEDDYDSEFRRKGRPIEPLKVLDYENRVIYLGTFSKTILPALRIGYAVIPSDIKPYFHAAKYFFEPYTTSALEQMAIANFLRTGSYEKHIRKMNRIYSNKYQLFKNLFNQYLPTAFDWIESESGLHLFGWWRFTEGKYQQFIKRCNEREVFWVNVVTGFSHKPPRPCGIFGFSHLTEDQMIVAISTMGEVFNDIMDGVYV
ncbi:PLP-dependent aminotransferase family protein [Cytobacillus sp. FJAT-54145]|uniref:PLP-dependent aminotransferase family protein n=1 Tax=Cytobacillus spartinae TaxID=3299023 RepID=A0ABW6KGK6_9BACI